MALIVYSITTFYSLMSRIAEHVMEMAAGENITGSQHDEEDEDNVFGKHSPTTPSLLITDSSSQGSSSETSTLTWIVRSLLHPHPSTRSPQSWYTSIPGHDYFCQVHEDFIEDDFNLTGLQSMVPFWKEALEMVLDVEPEDPSKIPDVSIVEASAELLYGLCHQRFILTKAGLNAMVCLCLSPLTPHPSPNRSAKSTSWANSARAHEYSVIPPQSSHADAPTCQA